MKKRYKFTIELVRELTQDELFALEHILAVQCEDIVVDMGDGNEQVVELGYTIGSERLEKESDYK